MDDSNVMKVLVLATTFPRWEGDSMPQFVYELSQELHRNGREVTVLVPHYPGAERYEEMNGLSVRRYPYFFPDRYQKVAYNGGVMSNVRNSLLALCQLPMFLLSLVLHSFWLLWREDFDAVHSHWILPNGVLGGIASILFGTPHIMTLHAGGVRGLETLPAESIIARLVYENTEAIAPVSTYVQDRFVRLIGTDEVDLNDFQVQPMGTHISELSSHTVDEVYDEFDTETHVVGMFVGRLAEGKGVPLLLDATAQLQEKYDHFKLVVVGSGPMGPELREYANNLGIKHGVEFTGWLSGKDLRDQFALADFVVIPSTVDEGMPTVISEAFASHNPVVASEVGGIPDVIEDGDNGFLINAGQTDELVKAISILIEDRRRRKRMASNAYESAQQLSWSRCGETYSKLLSDVTEEPEI